METPVNLHKSSSNAWIGDFKQRRQNNIRTSMKNLKEPYLLNFNKYVILLIEHWIRTFYSTSVIWDALRDFVTLVVQF